MYKRLIDFILGHPVVVLAAVAIVTSGLATQLPNLRIDTDADKFIPSHDDAATNQHFVDEVFGLRNIFLIVVEREDHPDGIYNPQTLALLQEIVEWLRARPEFETALNSDLRAIPTTNDIIADADGLTVVPFMDDPPATPEQALRVKRAVEHNPIFLGILASRDGKAAMILVRESAEGKRDRGALYYTVRDYLDGLRRQGHPEHFHIAGRPVVEGLFGIYIPQEASRLLPFVFGVIGLMLFVAFRSIRGVVIPFAILLCTEIWMFGILAMWGHPFYTVTSILPSLMVAIAVADAIHLLAKYYDLQREHPEADRRTVVSHTMEEMGAPILMTSVTTCVGFLAMLNTGIVPLSDFGIIATVGIMSAFGLTVILTPAFLILLPLQPSRRRGAVSGVSAVDERLLLAPTRWVNAHPTHTLGLFVAVVAVACAGLPLLKTDSSMVAQFPPGHHLRDSDAAINARFAGSTLLDVVLDGRKVDAVKNPEMLRRIDAFQQRVEQIPGVGDTVSIAEIIKRMNRMMHGDDATFETVPDTRELVAQYLLLYSISGDPGDFDDIVDYDYRYARIIVYLNDSGTATATRVERRVHEIAGPLFDGFGDPPVDLRMAGSAYTVAHTEHHVLRGQLLTLAICLPSMFVLTWMLFRMPLAALLSVMPVSLTVAVVYGLMGYVGLPLEIANIMLGGMAVGIGIDFAIHYLFKYRSCRMRGMGHEAACLTTAATAGRALLFNAAVLLGGFGVLLTARLYPQMKLGGLVAATLLICFLSTIYVFPVVLRALREPAPEAAASTNSVETEPA